MSGLDYDAMSILTLNLVAIDQRIARLERTAGIADDDLVPADAELLRRAAEETR